METIQADIYDYPKYYDVLFASDWKAEYDFLLRCFAKHAKGEVRRLFRARLRHGTLAYQVRPGGLRSGRQRPEPKAVKPTATTRLKRNGFPETAQVGDMCDFRLKKKAQAAFNTINSFRHLQTEDQAARHLECVAQSLTKGGIYVLGLHLTPDQGALCEHEAWSAQRGHLCINSEMQSLEVDRRKRTERVRFMFDVYTPTRQFRLCRRVHLPHLHAKQFQNLLDKVPQFELIETYDFAYEIDRPITIDPETEDVVYILKKK
jgi:hypothetical protein